MPRARVMEPPFSRTAPWQRGTRDTLFPIIINHGDYHAPVGQNSVGHGKPWNSWMKDKMLGTETPESGMVQGLQPGKIIPSIEPARAKDPAFRSRGVGVGVFSRSDMPVYASGGKRDMGRLPLESPGESTDVKRCHANWNVLVGTYSGTQLTKEDDIFPAISGLAQRFQAALQSNYLAGLWQDSFPQSLLWVVMDSCQSGRTYERRPTHWRAPSWSWASLRSTPIIYNQYGWEQDEWRCKVIQAVFKPATLNPAGRLASWGSYLTLRGRLVSTTLRLDLKQRHTDYIHKIDICDRLSRLGADYLRADDDFYLRCGKHNDTFPVCCLLFGLQSSENTFFFLVLRRVGEEEAKMIDKAAAESMEVQSVERHQYLRVDVLKVTARPSSVDLVIKGKEVVITMY
jgi:hypothetical protein